MESKRVASVDNDDKMVVEKSENTIQYCPSCGRVLDNELVSEVELAYPSSNDDVMSNVYCPCGMVAVIEIVPMSEVIKFFLDNH